MELGLDQLDMVFTCYILSYGEKTNYHYDICLLYTSDAADE